MNTPFFYALIGLGLFCVGLHALIVHAHLLRKILALNVMSNGVFLLLVALAGRTGEAQPDPVPFAMVITGIVVAVSATALALVLMVQVAAATGSAELRGQRQDPP